MNKVYIVGAGPSDLKLLTIKALEAIEKADVIVYDNLINDDILDKNSRAEKIYCGKIKGYHSMPQEEINKLLVKLYEEGKNVVRLKGGDPFIFGRGGEEALYLKEKKARYEIVPGITSGIAALTYAGIPSSHRETATSVHLITGHEKDPEKLDFSDYAKLKGTLIFYMGVGNINHISKSLIAGGMDPKKDMAIIYKGTSSEQEELYLKLEDAKNIDPSTLKTPSIIAVGDVISLKDKISWRDNLPLKGLRLVGTRDKNQNEKLKTLSERMGATFTSLQAIKTRFVEADLIELIGQKTGLLVFSSANGVKYFFQNLFSMWDIRDIGGYKILAIGQKTKEALKNYGIIADALAKEATSEGLVEAIKKTSQKDVFLVRPVRSREYIYEALKDKINIRQLVVYETLRQDITDDALRLLIEKGFDYILFASSFTVSSLMEAIKEAKLDQKEKDKLYEMIKGSSISIGPSTSKTLKSYQISPIEAKGQTIEDMLEAVERTELEKKQKI